MLSAIAIDDEPIAIKVIENFCKEISLIKLEKTFTNSADGLKHLNKFPVDLLLLDIDMPNMNGIDLYKQIKQNTLVIFITSNPNYAVEGFNLNAVDYLVKPYTFERFNQALKKASDLIALQSQNNLEAESQHFFIRADFSLIKVSISQILYIEGLDDYLKIHLENQKAIVARITMKNLLAKLPASNFVRIHRSFIINKKRLERIKGKFVFVAGKELPIGASYENDIQSTLTT